MKLPPAPQWTTMGFVFPNVERALADSPGRRAFGWRERELVIAFFGDAPARCVFCGESDVRRWDHRVPVSTGGETVPGNDELSPV